MSPLAPLPAGRRGDDRLSLQPAHAGDTHSKAALGCALPCLQQPLPAPLPVQHLSSTSSGPRRWFWHGQETPPRSISYLCTRPRSSPLLDKENKLKINPSVNGEVRWENY